MSNKGTHIAFTAGTGCLVFIDLVAHLIRKNVGLLSKEEDFIVDNSNFKFVFYVSFHRREDAIGLELMEGLHRLCLEREIYNFELVVRLTSENYEWWDFGYIER